ncbi:MAG: GNAT family N-acetyltransferase [Janthinobacterium lividum]
MLIRRAVPDDADRITKHRQKMFRENQFGSDDVLTEMAVAFGAWVRQALQDDRYAGILVEENGEVIAGAGVFFAEFPPHWRHPEPLRAYICNVYTEPAHRGRGLAKLRTEKLLDECRQRNVETVVLHASSMGRPVYEKLGFVQSDEMILSLGLSAKSSDDKNSFDSLST